MDEDILAAVSDALRRGDLAVVDASRWFDEIERAFPAGYNRILWERVPGAELSLVLATPRQIHADELAERLAMQRATVEGWLRTRQAPPAGDVVWIGDSTDFGLRMAEDVMLREFPALMSLPQHSYFFPEDMGWCLNYLMEGELRFGRRVIPSPASP